VPVWGLACCQAAARSSLAKHSGCSSRAWQAISSSSTTLQRLMMPGAVDDQQDEAAQVVSHPRLRGRGLAGRGGGRRQDFQPAGGFTGAPAAASSSCCGASVMSVHGTCKQC